MISIDILNLTKQRVSLKKLKAVAEFSANYLKLKGEISVVLGGDKRLKSLNNRFRGIEKSTDVLTFLVAGEKKSLLGEIFINLNDCRRPRKYREVFSFSPSYDYLLYFLLIHGLLHLAGYNDEVEKERLAIIALGEKIMKLLQKNDIIKTTV